MLKGNKDAPGGKPADVTTAISTTSLDRTVASDVSLDLTCYSEDNLGTARYSKSNENLGTAKDTSIRTACPSRSEENLGTAKVLGPRTARHAKSTENLGTAKDTNIRTAAEPDADAKTCNSKESLATCRSDDSLGTAIEKALRTASSMENLGTAKDTNIRTARPSRSEDNLGTAKDTGPRTARQAKSTENLGTANDANIRTAAEPDSDERTCNSADSLGTCRSEENVGTAIEEALRTARFAKSLEDIVTALGSSTNVRTALQGSCSLESLQTALENIDPEQLEAIANDSLTGSPSIYCMDVSLGTDPNSPTLAQGVPSQYQLPELRNYSALNNPESAYQYKLQEVLPANRNVSVSAARSAYILPSMND